jgi:trigger factor
VNISTKDISETRKTLIVSVSGQEVEAEAAKLLGEFSHSVKVQGFRPGKAPAALIKKRYGKELESELNRKVTSEAYEKSLKDSKLDIYNVVSVDEAKFSPGKDGKVEITVDVTPSFNLPEYKGIPAEVSSADVDETEVDNAIEEIRKQRSDFKEITRDVKKGDFVKVSYEGKIGKQLIAEIVPDQHIYGKQENTWEEAGAENDMGVKAVVEGLIGMKVGDKKDAEMKFPKDFTVAELKGKKAEYTMEVHEVRERVLPELNEEFLKQLHVETLEQFRKQINDELKHRKENEINQSLRYQITEALDKRIEFPLPESAIEFEAAGIFNDIVNQNRQRGIPESEFQKHEEEVRINAKSTAAHRVKLQIILGRIAKEEKIEIKNEDIQSHIMAEAMQTGRKPDQILKELQKSRGQMMAIQKSIIYNKTLEYLVKESVVTVKKS